MNTIKNFDEFLKESSSVESDKVLFTMHKEKSPLHVVVIDDSENMIKIKYINKNGIMKKQNTIVKKDLEQWTDSLERDGYKKD